MSVDLDIRQSGLRAVLEQYGITEQRLMAEANNPFGEPVVISASGSQVLGYHTDRQFVQLDVVVEADNITDFAVASYIDDLRVETIFFGGKDVLGRAAALRAEPWPTTGHIDRGVWLRREQQLNTVLRFRLGTTMLADGPWSGHIDTLREDWLPAEVSNWWRTEARRRWQAARWLGGDNAIAAHRYCDAVLHAVEAQVTSQDYLSLAGGHFSLGPCWLVDRLDGWLPGSGFAPTEVLRTALRVPRSAGALADYVAWCERVLTELLGSVDDDGRLCAQLRYSPGVTVRSFGNHTLVSRWEMRAVEFDNAIAVPGDDVGVVWQGEAGSTPPDEVLELFGKEMLWLGMLAA